MWEFDRDGLMTVFLSAGAIAGFASLLLQILGKGTVDFWFGRKMESYKRELESVTERERYEFQRRLHDMTQFSTQRQTAYAELLALANRSMRPLLNAAHILKTRATREYAHGAEVDDALRDAGIPVEKREAIVKRWESGDPKARGDLLLRDQARSFVELAENDIVEAEMHFLRDALFISDDVSAAYVGFRNGRMRFRNMVLAFSNFADPDSALRKLPPGPTISVILGDVSTAHEGCAAAFHKLRNTMRAELGMEPEPASGEGQDRPSFDFRGHVLVEPKKQRDGAL